MVYPAVRRPDEVPHAPPPTRQPAERDHSLTSPTCLLLECVRSGRVSCGQQRMGSAPDHGSLPIPECGWLVRSCMNRCCRDVGASTSDVPRLGRAPELVSGQHVVGEIVLGRGVRRSLHHRTPDTDESLRAGKYTASSTLRECQPFRQGELCGLQTAELLAGCDLRPVHRRTPFMQEPRGAAKPRIPRKIRDDSLVRCWSSAVRTPRNSGGEAFCRTSLTARVNRGRVQFCGLYTTPRPPSRGSRKPPSPSRRNLHFCTYCNCCLAAKEPRRF